MSVARIIISKFMTVACSIVGALATNNLTGTCFFLTYQPDMPNELDDN